MNIDDIEAFVFDFDGVLTDNLVYVNQHGEEMVSCSRADGLAFDVLRNLEKPAYILSTEKNLVVSARAKKLKIKVIQGATNKSEELKYLASKEGYNIEKVLYVGNDLNDYHVMKLCGTSVCPADGHSEIKKISDVVLKTRGGKGVVRELLEDVLCLDFLKCLNN